MLDHINGYKTYILALLIMLNGILYGFSLYGMDVFLAVNGVLGGGAAATLRHGIKK